MKYISRLSLFITVLSSTILIAVSSAFAAEDEGAVVTNQVDAMKTEHKWFYWPGWAFAGLLFLAIAVILFSWWKLVLEPKYRGRKVTQ